LQEDKIIPKPIIIVIIRILGLMLFREVEKIEIVDILETLNN
jgi:hypothetical protein